MTGPDDDLRKQMRVALSKVATARGARLGNLRGPLADAALALVGSALEEGRFAVAHIEKWQRVVSEHEAEAARLRAALARLVLTATDSWSPGDADFDAQVATAETTIVGLRDLHDSMSAEGWAEMREQRDEARARLRGMARKVVASRAELHEAVEDWGRNDAQVLADSTKLAEENEWLSEACRLTVREAAAVRAERDWLLKDATPARQKLIELIGGDWTVEPSLDCLAALAVRFWGDDRKELERLRAEVDRLTLEIQGYQVGDPYERGHEHGVQAALARLSGGNTPADAATIEWGIQFAGDVVRAQSGESAAREYVDVHNRVATGPARVELVKRTTSEWQPASPGWGSAVATPAEGEQKARKELAHVYGVIGDRALSDMDEPGACSDKACPRPAGPHGVCLGHSCGGEVADTDIVCRLASGHGGVWHDSGTHCWLVSGEGLVLPKGVATPDDTQAGRTITVCGAVDQLGADLFCILPPEHVEHTTRDNGVTWHKAVTANGSGMEFATTPPGWVGPKLADLAGLFTPADTNYLCSAHWVRYLRGSGWWDETCERCDHVKARTLFGDESPAPSVGADPEDEVLAELREDERQHAELNPKLATPPAAVADTAHERTKPDA